MKGQELTQKSIEELKELLKEKQEKLYQMSFDLSSGKVKNVKEIRGAKKDIARIMTEMNKKAKSQILNNRI